MSKNKAGVEIEGKGETPAAEAPSVETPPSPAPGVEEINPEEIDEEGGKGKQVPVSALIKMRQERNRIRDEIAELRKAGVPADTLKSAMRETILEMAGEEEEARRQAAAEAETAGDGDYDWNDEKLKPLARRFQKLETENKGLRERLDKGELDVETKNVRKETDDALAKFPRARRKEILAEAYIHPEKSIMEIAAASHREMEGYDAGVINAYATGKGKDDKGSGGPSGGQPPVTPTERPDIESDTKGFITRLKEKLKIND